MSSTQIAYHVIGWLIALAYYKVMATEAYRDMTTDLFGNELVSLTQTQKVLRKIAALFWPIVGLVALLVMTWQRLMTRNK